MSERAARAGAAVAVAPPRGRARAPLRGRAWGIVAALALTETVSWGVLYYAFAVFQLPMQRELGWSAAQLAAGFSLALLVSAGAGVAVGRLLDRRGPRALFTGGSLAGALLVACWSQVQTLGAYYLLWALLGLVMAAVLYEPAFVVLAKWFGDPGERRRAMTAMTLVAALASFVFLPLGQWLIEAVGWRDALLVLALVLAVLTVPPHALALRDPPGAAAQREAARRPAGARAVLRSRAFWLTTVAFVLGAASAVAVTVHALPFLVERGYSGGFAAFALGTVGVAQIPGRLLFATLAGRLGAAAAGAAPFALVALGVALVGSAAGEAAVLAGMVVIGMGNGMATLARATALADRYGQALYGTVAGVAGGCATAARAVAPVAAAACAAWAGYASLMWALAAAALAAAALAWLGAEGA